MGTVELWLGRAGCGKTGQALHVLRDELLHDSRGVRYLVPTVGHKRSIEHLLLSDPECTGLLGDPVTTFFNFAEEVAARARVQGRALTEVQKFLMLKRLLRETPTDAYQAVKRYPGFLQALRDAIDEMKVHMIRPEAVQAAAKLAEGRGLPGLARKLDDLCHLYGEYQSRVFFEQLYDNEGIMWIAAEALDRDPSLFAELRCLVLDGFARLTPVQVDFIRSLAARAARIIVLFDCDRGRQSGTYHPVLDSINALRALGRHGVAVRAGSARYCPKAPQPATTALRHAQRSLFRTAPEPWTRHDADDSLQLFIGATPAHEAEMIAREIHALLRRRPVIDGAPLAAEDIAILARSADGVTERMTQALARAGVPFQQAPALLAHTGVGRALLGAFALVREGWERERVIPLLKSGFLAIPRNAAFRVDMAARAAYLRPERAAWTAQWPDDDTREALQAALTPLLAFDDIYWQSDGAGLLDGVRALLAAFRAVALPEAIAFPDADPDGAERRTALQAACATASGVLDELQGLGALLGGFRGEELLDVITTALLQEPADAAPASGEGVVIRSAHATGGQKFKVAFLCDLREGAFPRHLRESAFLLDEERERDLPGLQMPLSPRKHMEEDERYWFLHAVNSASHRLVLSYPAHSADGTAFERSSFLDEVVRIAPELQPGTPFVRATQFRDLVPPLAEAEHAGDFLAGLVMALRATAVDDPAAGATAAAYAAWLGTGDPALMGICAQAAPREGALTAEVIAALAARTAPFSATELQRYMDCPFLWFVFSCLRAQPPLEEFGALDRGSVLHTILKLLYEGLETPLAACAPEGLLVQGAALLAEHLAALPGFQCLPAHLRAIEEETLKRMLARFLAHEIERARGRNLRPSRFELPFVLDLELAGTTITLRGAIDRVDLTPTVPRQAVIIDYKFSTSDYGGSNLERGKVLQAPLYALAVRALLHAAPLGVEFLGLRKGDVRGIGSSEMTGVCESTSGIKLLEPAGWDAFLHGQAARIAGLVARMAQGDIPLDPHTHRCPNRCQAWPICRGEWVALKARYLANEKGEETEE
jgi:ATP-dependent helicase/DNAse subunit B